MIMNEKNLEKGFLTIGVQNSGYSVEQVKRTMTVGELKSLLEDFDDDLPIFTKFDNGYSFGGLAEKDFEFTENDETC